MNIFSASVRAEGDLVYVEHPGLCLRVPPEKAQPLRPYAGKEILFGIRPENMSDRRLSEPCDDESCLLARVEVVENMGHEKFVHLRAGDQTLVARVDPRTAAMPGDEISVAVAMPKMHAFDTITEQAAGVGA
ncbi:MAG: TOBE domain-containing protein [Dehalococcoidia bacterium]|nr:TOBE domain-containing protein [Dehalococcoidia bacterium]